MLELGILIPPAASGAVWNQFPTEPGRPYANRPQAIQPAALGTAKVSVNGEDNRNKPDSPLSTRLQTSV
jgi:hypothetical protein